VSEFIQELALSRLRRETKRDRSTSRKTVSVRFFVDAVKFHERHLEELARLKVGEVGAVGGEELLGHLRMKTTNDIKKDVKRMSQG
jgi:hypothetical protein